MDLTGLVDEINELQHNPKFPINSKNYERFSKVVNAMVTVQCAFLLSESHITTDELWRKLFFSRNNSLSFVLTKSSFDKIFEFSEQNYIQYINDKFFFTKDEK